LQVSLQIYDTCTLVNENSAKSVQRLRKSLGLKGTVQQAATFETLIEIYNVMRGRFPTMGARRMVTTIRQDYSIKVSEYVCAFDLYRTKKLIY
jgi:hypothetical protein